MSCLCEITITVKTVAPLRWYITNKLCPWLPWLLQEDAARLERELSMTVCHSGREITVKAEPIGQA